MMEMKIKIEVPDLAAAICKLAAAVTPPDFNILTPDEPKAIPAPVVEPVAPVNPAPEPVQSAPAAPAPVSAPAPAPVQMPVAQATPAPAPAVPVAPPPSYTLDQIARAGASLVDAGKMEQLLALLGRYGVAAVTQLQPDQFGVFATELRALGAQI